MSKVINDENVHKRLEKLNTTHQARKHRQVSMKWLSRGFDPTTVGEENSSWERILPKTDRGTALSTNDPATYLELANHLLSGEPINWQMPRTPLFPTKEQEVNGMLERIVKAYLQQNNRRLYKKGVIRLERAVADSFCRFGMAVVHKKIVKLGSNLPEFFLEPWDPVAVSERMDDYGLTELARSFKTTAQDLMIIGENEGGEGWHFNTLKVLEGDSAIEEMVVSDFYYRWFDTDDTPVVEHAVIGNIGGTERILKSLTIMDDELEIPVELRLANGEAFPGEQLFQTARSILEVNYEIYLQQDKDIKKIEIHRDRALAQKFAETTLTGEPNVSAEELADPTTVTRASYRPGESLDLITNNPFDPTVSLLPDIRAGMIQRGAVPYILQGGLEINLSGFAIFQLQKAALAAVGEVKAVANDFYSDIGKWILDGVRNGGFKEEKITSIIYGSGRATPQLDTFSSSDIPEYTSIQASIDLSQPSDLIERIQMARAANPTGGDIFTPETVYDILFSREIPDAAGEAKAVENSQIRKLPIFRMLKMRRTMIEDARRHELRGEQFEANGLRQSIALLESNIRGGSSGNNPQTNEGEASGIPDTRVSSTDARTNGVDAPTGRPGANQT